MKLQKEKTIGLKKLKKCSYMTAAELLKPRFEVIDSYPKSPYKKGDILVSTSFINDNEVSFEGTNYSWAKIEISDCLKHPNIFKKLNWWEHRKQEDMPKRLICKAIENDNQVHEIEYWDMNILFGFTDKESRKGCGLRSFSPEYGYFPVD